MTTTDSPPHAELRLPADSAYLAVLRTATAGLAARINFTLDDIEDLRIAVDEACAILLPQAREALLRGRLGRVAVRADRDGHRGLTQPETALAEEGFAWRVLTALTTFADSSVEDGRLILTLSRSAGQHP